jgi:phage shock protein C
MVCAKCGSVVNDGAKFCPNCGAAVVSGATHADGRPRLVRPLDGRKIAGVCAGISQYTGWDLTLVRVVAVLLVFFGVGTPLLAYFIGWLIIPEGPLVMQPPRV